MSGGIDSSVAAILLKDAGWEVIGITYRIYDNPLDSETEEETVAIKEAREVAERLHIEHRTLDLRREFRETVIDYFIREYSEGRTPNPCVVCNPAIKWTYLLEAADALNCSRIATGHYARIGKENGRYFLKKAEDLLKDQTYFLWKLSQEQLARTLFPIGGLTKEEIRDIARAKGFTRLSKKSESQEICFIPDNDYRKFLTDEIPDFEKIFKPGDFVDGRGKVIGAHKGFPNYTIGQRKGLGVAAGYPLYVLSIDPQSNKIILGSKEELGGSLLYATDINYMKRQTLCDGENLSVKIRYRNTGYDASVYPEGRRLRIEFREKADAITPGQSCVLYEGEDVVAGSIIHSVRPEK